MSARSVLQAIPLQSQIKSNQISTKEQMKRIGVDLREGAPTRRLKMRPLVLVVYQGGETQGTEMRKWRNRTGGKGKQVSALVSGSSTRHNHVGVLPETITEAPSDKGVAEPLPTGSWDNIFSCPHILGAPVTQTI